jgi:hypothetical protein
MNRGPRFFIAFIITLIIAGIVIKYGKVKPEVYIPPPNLYQYAIEKVTGYVTGTETKTYGEHLLEGSEDFHYIIYKFQPRRMKDISYATNHTQGKVVQQGDAPWFTGEVRVDETDVDQNGSGKRYKAGSEITVLYDPNDPRINGVPGTKGYWSKTTGYLNPYLWWYVAFAAVVFVIQEIIRIATRTNDL